MNYVGFNSASLPLFRRSRKALCSQNRDSAETAYFKSKPKSRERETENSGEGERVKNPKTLISMAETLICTTETEILLDGCSDRTSQYSNGLSSSSSAVFKRKIEFHAARKSFTGIGYNRGDFKLETLNPSVSDPNRLGSNTGQSGLGGKKADGSEVLEHGLDPELSLGITVRRIGAGLQNLGNTCFLNSVLQCLTYTEPLAAYLQSGKHQNSCHIAGFCALCAIQKHVSRALQSTGRILAPKDLVSNLRCISRNFRNARQEDAHEYMVNLLESMHKCCLPSGVPSESPGAYEKSLVHKIFGGRLRSQVKCMQCSYCSNKFDPFLDLSLEIAKADSVHKALSNFTAKEFLDGGERQYQCQRCKEKVRALKQLTVHKAPYVLTIHLKRFRAHDPGQKIDKKVQFGPTLDLKSFVSDSYEGDLKYTLYGVLVHYGWTTHSGHYYCFVRTSSGMWYSLDDNRVVQVSERTVLEQKAYMLFYVRDRRTIAPRKPVNIVPKENVKVNISGNKTFSSFNQGLKEPILNGPIENRLNGVDPSAAVNRKDALIVGSSKGTLVKEASVQQNDGLTMAERSVPVKDPKLEPSSKVPLSKETLWNDASVQQNDGLTMAECSVPVKDPKLKPSSKVPLSKETLLNEASVQQNDGLTMAERSVPIKDSKLEPSSKVPLSDETLKGLSGPNPILGESLLPSVPTDNGKEDGPNLEKAIITTDGAKINDCNEKGMSKNALSVPVTISPSCNDPEKFATGKFVTKETYQKIDLVSNKGLLSTAPSMDTSDRTLEKTDPFRSPNQPSCENSQVKGIPSESGAGNSPSEKGGESGKKLVPDESIELPSLSPMTSGSLHMEVLDSRRKLKKKLLKCQVASMYLGPNILFRASLNLRKKKKHRRSKHRTLDTKHLIEEHLLHKDCVSSDLGPSTSEKTKTISLVSTHSKGKGTKSGSRKGENGSAARDVIYSNGNSLMDIKDGGFRGRNSQNGAVLATDVSLENSSSSSAAIQPSKGSKSDVIQNGLMSMLTRGLEETIVSRWDEIELHPTKIEESNGGESISIGYVPDEWDEEYDRGKRKKVRQFKHSFGGPNPFQEIATNKSQFKKAKLDRSSSGNQPFRI